MKKVFCIVMMCALLIAPVFTISAAAAVPYGSMIALYNMEGALKDDVSGKDGTLKNGASFVNDSARGGNVLSLNNDDMVSPGQEDGGYETNGQHAILAEPHIPSTDAMTISIWFKAKEERSWARVIDFGDAKAETSDSPDRFMNISPFANSSEYTAGTVNANDGAHGIPNNRDRVFADVSPVNEWVHAVLVIDVASGKPNVLYLNGKAFESTHGAIGDDPEPAAITPKDILEAAEGVGKTYLGRSRYENNGDQIFNGFIDDVAIFNVALTADQVAELTKVDFTKGNPANVVAQLEEALVAARTQDEAVNTPAEAPVAAAAQSVTPAAVTAPKTNDSVAIMIVLMGLSVIGSGIYAYSKKTRI